MKISSVTITGVDDHTDLDAITALSLRFPWVEWGVLFSATRMGTGRYPNAQTVQAILAHKKTNPSLRFAAHLCGTTMRGCMTAMATGGDGIWLAPYGLSLSGFNTTFNRVQVNFSMKREQFSSDFLGAMLEGWVESMDSALITQHNENNAHAWEAFQAHENAKGGCYRVHQVLHDASGGTGALAPSWQPPLAGFPNGYAGGLGPDTVEDILLSNAGVVGEGVIWIDMESKVRTPDDKLDLDKVADVLERVQALGEKNSWFFS